MMKQRTAVAPLMVTIIELKQAAVHRAGIGSHLVGGHQQQAPLKRAVLAGQQAGKPHRKSQRRCKVRVQASILAAKIGSRLLYEVLDAALFPGQLNVPC